MNADDRWEWAAIRVAGYDRRRYGSCWRSWGICRTRERWFRVVHLPSGRRLTEFDRLRIARRFCEAIDKLTDWSRPPAELAADTQLAMELHRVALRLTGSRPALRVIDGGVP